MFRSCGAGQGIGIGEAVAVFEQGSSIGNMSSVVQTVVI